MLTIQQPTQGTISLSAVVVLGELPDGVTLEQPAGEATLMGCVAVTDIPAGCELVTPTGGTLRFLGVLIVGNLTDGVYTQGLN